MHLIHIFLFLEIAIDLFLKILSNPFILFRGHCKFSIHLVFFETKFSWSSNHIVTNPAYPVLWMPLLNKKILKRNDDEVDI